MSDLIEVGFEYWGFIQWLCSHWTAAISWSAHGWSFAFGAIMGIQGHAPFRVDLGLFLDEVQTGLDKQKKHYL